MAQGHGEPLRVAVVGAGWAGLAAAVQAAADGHRVTVFEAARTPGGRARALDVALPDGRPLRLDNGQHILAGAYTGTLRLMRELGVDAAAALLRAPLALRFPDGSGLALPDWPAPLDALWGIARVRGWRLGERAALLGAAARWRRQGFECDDPLTVADLCRGLPPRVLAELIDPLCVSALNTPMQQASARVFLRVMRDALFSRGEDGMAGSNLLLPRQDLGALMPDAAVRRLRERGHLVHLGRASRVLHPGANAWALDGEAYDRIILACPPGEAARLVSGWATGGGATAASDAASAQTWAEQARALRHEPIATVYTQAPDGVALPFARGLPMLALPAPGPAQFVFDRGALGGPPGLLAFVASACHLERHAVEAAVLSQAAALGWPGLKPVQTVVEKRATFACTTGMRRPAARIAAGLLAAGDYVDGPYPATLEGAVRSGLAAAAALDMAGLS